MSAEPFQYHVCIVRAWREMTLHTSEPVWRFTLEIPGTGQRFGFNTSQALIEALDAKLDDVQYTGLLPDDL